MLPGDRLQGLEAILREAVVQVEVYGTDGRARGRGTGFVVESQLVLTCYHVVKGAVEGDLKVRVVAVGHDAPVEATIVEPPRGPGWPDLALLQVAVDLPAVVLDESQVPREMRLLAAGFPEGTVVDYQVPGMVANGYAEDAHRNQFLAVRDVQIEHGLSGGPVVERDGGFVCGVTRLTKNPNTPVGGFVIPVGTVLEAYPELRKAHDRPGPAARRWASALGADHLARFNRSRDGHRKGLEPVAPRIDLHVLGAEGEGMPRSWSVEVGFPEASGVGRSDVSLADLGDDLIEALDRWSRRRPLESEDEVELLGRVLHRAIVPKAVAQYIDTVASGSDSLLLRLLVRSGRLSEIPWEYATPQGGPPLSTNPKVTFARFADVACPRPAPKDHLKLLLAVVCPRDIHSRLGSSQIVPEAADVAALFEELIRDRSGGRISVEPLVNPDATRFKEAARAADVVHYLGFGMTPLRSSEGQLCFCNTSGRAVYVRPERVFEKRDAALGALVVQLQVPPGDQREPPLPGGSLLPLLGQATAAVVSNSYPAPLDHLSELSAYLYGALAEGRTLEESVQAARIHLRDQIPGEDSTAFGMFSVTTCDQGGLQLLSGTGAAGRRGDSQPAAQVRPTPAARQAATFQTTDALST